MSKLSKDLGIVIGGWVGMSTFWLFSSPKSSMTKKVPDIEVKNVEILPNLEIKRKKQVFHIHHWMYLSVFYISMIAIGKPIKKKFLNGFVLGAIFQGLTYKDRLSIVEPRKPVKKN